MSRGRNGAGPPFFVFIRVHLWFVFTDELLGLFFLE